MILKLGIEYQGLKVIFCINDDSGLTLSYYKARSNKNIIMSINIILDLMFMKHYAPSRCSYIKVAKLRTGVGSAETSYLQNYSVRLFKEHFKVQICKGRLLKKILIILYQLTKFEAPSCYSFRDIMNTNFQSPNLQREIIRKK